MNHVDTFVSVSTSISSGSTNIRPSGHSIVRAGHCVVEKPGGIFTSGGTSGTTIGSEGTNKTLLTSGSPNEVALSDLTSCVGCGGASVAASGVRRSAKTECRACKRTFELSDTAPILSTITTSRSAFHTSTTTFVIGHALIVSRRAAEKSRTSDTSTACTTVGHALIVSPSFTAVTGTYYGSAVSHLA